jgi:hypothetical protein
MSDFFGGILDDLRGSVTSAGDFFDSAVSSLGKEGGGFFEQVTGEDSGPLSMLKNLGSALPTDKLQTGVDYASNFDSLSRSSGLDASIKYNSTKTGVAEAVDPKYMEREWMLRLKNFSNVKKETGV